MTAVGSSRPWRSGPRWSLWGPVTWWTGSWPPSAVLALIYAAGTGLLAILASGWVRLPGGLFGLFLVYWGLTAPAYSLCNALAMRNLDDPGREFGGVRLWGTAGWMVAGWVVSVVMAASGSTRAGQGAFEALWVATAVSAVTAVYCLTLPHTPPLAVGPRGRGVLRAGRELVRQPDIAVFLLASLGVYLTQPLVFQVIPGYLERRGLPRAWVSTAMTLGQTTEIAVLAILPWLLRRLGMKATLMLGILAWFARFLSLALDPPLWLAVAGTLLQGVGIACFTVGGQVFLDGRAPSHLRARRKACCWSPLPASPRSSGVCLRARWWAGPGRMMFWCSCSLA